MLSEERKARIKHNLFDVPHGFDPIVAINNAYIENKGLSTHELLRAKIDAATLDAYPVFIDPDDLIAGHRPLWDDSEEVKNEREEARRQMNMHGQINGIASSSTAHRVIDYEKLLEKGLSGVLNEVKQKLAAVEFSDPECADKRSFYNACIISLEAAIRFQEKYHAEAVRLLNDEQDPERIKELKNMVAALENVPKNPARNFREAIQSIWLMEFMANIIGENILTGRPDNYLYPFYKKDIESETITDDEVFTLIEDLYFRHNDIYGSWPAALMVGGRKRNGEPNWNELSYMCIRAIETTGLVNPSVAVCYNEAMPDDLLTLCLEMIEKGYTRPSFFNDDIAIKGLKEAGVSDEDANYYIHSTCVELTPIATSNILVATPYINLNKGLEYILNNGEKIFGNDFQRYEIKPQELSELDTFEKFYDATKAMIENILKGELENIQTTVLFRKRYSSLPLVSCFINDCIAMGKEAANDGARYSFIYPCFPGFINLIDSLSAIRKVVYEEKRVTLEELRDALKGNFDGEERLRAFLLNKCPKFGNDIDESDEIAKDLFLYIKDELKQFNTCIRNGTFHPSYFAWIMHGVLGEVGAATPDGRKQAEALSECLGSVQGMDKNGPIALMYSTSKIPQHYGIGGIATNFRFSKRFMHEGFDQIKVFIKEFMKNGNFEAQFNVVDQQTLYDALEHPEKHKTLLVRVAGYSDYFVNLAPIIQREIISRLEHDGL
ncbi:MAG: hypothetical protein IJF23_00055 [Clostridia bacterium]|nr:hypothetical protein [Clostridia bacterium]